MPIPASDVAMFREMMCEYYNCFLFHIAKLLMQHQIGITYEITEVVWDTIVSLVNEYKIFSFKDINKDTANMICQEMLCQKEGIDWIVMLGYIRLALEETYKSADFREHYKKALNQFRLLDP